MLDLDDNFRDSHLDEVLEEMYQAGSLGVINSNPFAKQQEMFRLREQEFYWAHPVTQEALTHLKKAKESREQEKPTDSIKACMKAIEADKNCLEAYEIAGELYMEDKNYNAAIKIFNKACHVFWGYAKVYFSMAKAYYELKKLENAIRYMELSLKYINFFNPQAHEFLEAWKREKASHRDSRIKV